MRLVRWGAVAAAAILLVCGGGILFLLAHWPFTPQAVENTLGSIFQSRIQIQNFRKTFFPPGCVAERVTFLDGRSQGGIERLNVITTWSGMLTGRKRIERIVATGLYVHVDRGSHRPPPATASRNSQLQVGEIVADGALLEVTRNGSGRQPLKFEVDQLRLTGIAAGRPITFRTVLRNPEPRGEIRASGRFGPLRSDSPRQTPVSGTFAFSHANLGVFRAIGGTLDSKGTFEGVLDRVEVKGETEMPDFVVTHSAHPVHLIARFQAVVNGTNGDTFLQPVNAQFERTTITSGGSVAGQQGADGKIWSFDLSVSQGHIQDLMHLLMRSDRPPMVGQISFRAKAIVPPEKRKFLERLQLSGDFGIHDVQFTTTGTQHNIDVLSERARGDKDDDNDPENVISGLKGHVVVRNGVARFSNLSFAVPGARAQLEGTFNLLNERIDLHGSLAMAAQLSQATKGFKSFLLKALDPFFKKKNAGAVVGVRITGTYSHPSYGVSLARHGDSHRSSRAVPSGA